MKKLPLWLTLTLFSIASPTLQAQGSGQPLRPYALKASAPIEESTVIGMRMLMSNTTAIDIDFAFDYQSDETVIANNAVSAKGLTLGIAGSLVNYFHKERVSPYIKFGGGLTLFSGDKADIRDNSVEVFAGLGTEFFVTPEFSLFVEAGLGVPLSPDFGITSNTSTVGVAFYF